LGTDVYISPLGEIKIKSNSAPKLSFGVGYNTQTKKGDVKFDFDQSLTTIGSRDLDDVASASDMSVSGGLGIKLQINALGSGWLYSILDILKFKLKDIGIYGTAKITSALNEPGVPLKTKSILQKTLGFICDKNGLGFDLDLSLLIKGLGLDALMDLLNCMSDDATIAGRVTKMMDMDVSSVAKNKTLNTVAGGGKLSTKGGLSVLDKQNTKDGIKNGLVDIKPFTHDVANSNKRFGTTDKKRYLEILGDNNDEFISTRREGSSRLVVDDMIEDVSNSRLKSKLVAPIDKDTRNIVKSRLVRA